MGNLNETAMNQYADPAWVDQMLKDQMALQEGAQVNTRVKITIKVPTDGNFANLKADVGVVSIENNFKKTFEDWIAAQKNKTSYKDPAPGPADCSKVPECAWYDQTYCWTCLCTSCGCGWEGVCKGNNALNKAKNDAARTLYPVTDCGIANTLLNNFITADGINNEVLSQLAYLIRVNATEPLRENLVKSPEVLQFFNDYLAKGMSRCT